MKRWIFLAIFLMTFLDAIMTAIGIQLGYIQEANPFLEGIFNFNPSIAAFLTVLFVSILLLIMYRVQDRIRWIKAPLIALFLVKVGVLGLHGNWIYLVMKG